MKLLPHISYDYFRHWECSGRIPYPTEYFNTVLGYPLIMRDGPAKWMPVNLLNQPVV